jgi:3-oxoadipate enol-lactonase
MPNNSVALEYEEFGKGLPVVFVHGFPFDHTTWLPLVPLLQDHARLILPDLRGFGKSPSGEDVTKQTMRMMADDILALLDTLGIEKAALVGHSMGGYVSLAFAQAHPHRLLGLGLVASSAAADKPERRQARMKMADEIKRRGVAHTFNGMAEKMTTQPNLVEPIRQLMLSQNPNTLIACQKGMAERSDMTEQLPSITCPSVVISASEDAMVSPERSQEANQLLGWSWLVEIPGGHLVMMEQPTMMADALHKFFHTVESNQPK